MRLTSAILILALAIFGASCAKKSSSSSPTANQLANPGDTSDTPGAPVDGNTDPQLTANEADFKPVSIPLFEEYVAERPLNNPDKFKVKVNVKRMWDDRIGGTVWISYWDNGQHYSGTFKSGNREDDVQYNEWFDHQGKEVFRGYFSDPYGAIVLVIDDVVDLGDGSNSADIVSGSIYFVNFEPSRAMQSPTRCWNIKYGPYACGAIFNGPYPGAVVNHDYPGKTYQKLGTFSGLSRSAAFNEDYN